MPMIRNSLKKKALNAFFYPVHSDFLNAFKKVPRLRSFVLSVTATCTWIWVRNIGGIILIGESWV